MNEDLLASGDMGCAVQHLICGDPIEYEDNSSLFVYCIGHTYQKLFRKVDQFRLPLILRKRGDAVTNSEPYGAWAIQAHVANDAIAGSQGRLLLKRIGAAAHADVGT